MGLSWELEDGAFDSAINIKSKFRAPAPGTTIQLSGASPQVSQQLSGNTLYVITATQDFRVISNGTAGSNATTSDLFWPASQPFYHFSETGVSDYLSIIEASSGSLDATVSVVYQVGV